MIEEDVLQTQIALGIDALEKMGMMEEFTNFYLSLSDKMLLDRIKEFAKLHPDKFYVPNNGEG